MGLNRTVTLSVKGFDGSEDHINLNNKISGKANELFAVGFEYDRPPTATGISWYDIIDDMKELSAFFPDVVLVIDVKEGSGDDNWTALFNNGEMAYPQDHIKFYPEAAHGIVWDNVEIMPVWCREDGVCDVCDAGKESMWSVYLHQASGGVVCIADTPSEKDAEDLMTLIKNLFCI